MTGLDWELFDRYRAGELAPAERERFERWLAERPERAAQAAAFRRAVELLASGVTGEEREAMWSGIFGPPAESPITVQVVSSPGAPPGRAVASTRRRMMAIAAALVLAAGGALASRAWVSNAERADPAAESVVTVPRAQDLRFRLPDGSEVVLGGGSTLRHPREFARGSREVTLEGQAFFVVEHDDARPFRVRAGDLVATDLGTEFLVRAYPEDPRGRVVVRSGTVAVRPIAYPDGADGGRVVHPGELGRLDGNGEPVVESADTAAYFAWTRGTLVFDNTPLREALPQLSRWYDLDFRLADSTLGSIPLSGTLDRTLTDDRLELLAASLGLRQARRGRFVKFFPAGTAP